MQRPDRANDLPIFKKSTSVGDMPLSGISVSVSRHVSDIDATAALFLLF